jgi:dTDP-6-deoxy-L-talose 4-dehydrogenase (NAD+)
VLVTGAGGYIGRHVVTALLDSGAEVTAVGRSIRAGSIDARADIQSADIFEPHPDPFERFGRPDVVVHLAWEAGFTHNAPAHLLNLSDHYRFLTALTDGGLKQLVVLGSMHEVGYHEGAIDELTPTNPLSLYGIAKDSLRRSLTLALAQTDVVLQWVRAYYIYGDDANNKSVFTKISEAAERGDAVFPFTMGTSEYDFVSVDELADQIAATSLQTTVAGVINCGSGEPVALGVQIERYIAEHGFEIALGYGAYPDRPYDSPATWGDPAKIREILAARGR